MSRSSRLALAGLACALALVPASAVRAEVVEPPIPLAGVTGGITAGVDGNVYVVETYNQSVAVLSPSGSLIRRVALTGTAGTAMLAALGPDGRVWWWRSPRTTRPGASRRSTPPGTSSTSRRA